MSMGVSVSVLGLTVINEGKTKMILAEDPSAELCVIAQKDDITAGDGAKHDVLQGKAGLANQTTCNVFEYLRNFSVPLAYLHRLTRVSFLAQRCTMLLYEIVVRGEAEGSYCKRNPDVPKGTVFEDPIIECYLKTSDRKWRNYDLICDDPFMQLKVDGRKLMIHLFDPSKPLDEPFLILQSSEVFSYPNEQKILEEAMQKAQVVYRALAAAWESEGGRLKDMKLEFGLNTKLQLLLADVIDNDSWRLELSGTESSKQGYRDGESLDTVLAKYQQVAEATSRFPLA